MVVSSLMHVGDIIWEMSVSRYVMQTL